MNLSEEVAVERFRSARVARLATVDADGQPHLVRVTLALWSHTIPLASDHKRNVRTSTKRPPTIMATGRVSLLADDYADQDWSRLWWVRVDGTARIVEDEQERGDQIARLCAKYPQYRENP